MNKEQLRIVYMGTPEFAVAGLRALVEGGYNVVAVVTMPDKPAGRGHQLQYSDVKRYALEVGLPVLQPERLKDEQFIAELRSYRVDLQVVTAFRMLPEVVWSMPRLGTFNIHGSLLPQYRGAAPINWAVMNGDTETGLTAFMLKHEIDTGNMIAQRRIEIGADECVGSVHDRLMALSGPLTCEVVDMIIDCDSRGVALPTTPQPEDIELRPAPKIFKDDCLLDFASMSARDIHNKVRGLSPYPAAWCDLDILGHHIERAKIYLTEVADGPARSDREIVIPCREGYIRILELQIPGKKRMQTPALLNGLH